MPLMKMCFILQSHYWSLEASWSTIWYDIWWLTNNKHDDCSIWPWKDFNSSIGNVKLGFLIWTFQFEPLQLHIGFVKCHFTINVWNSDFMTVGNCTFPMIWQWPFHTIIWPRCFLLIIDKSQEPLQRLSIT